MFCTNIFTQSIMTLGLNLIAIKLVQKETIIEGGYVI
jgi:hypothetical protein